MKKETERHLYGIVIFAIVILISALVFGCKPGGSIHEDTLYVTRKYIGDFDTLVLEKKTTCIYTDQALFRITGRPRLEIPDNARCYLRYIQETLPGNYTSVWILYFTWDGTDDLFKLRQNWYTGEVY